MTDLDTLLGERETLTSRLATIEAALAELRLDVGRLDEEIRLAQQQRLEAGKRGLRMYALLQEVRRELERHDAAIQTYVDGIADRYIGQRPGAYVLNGFVIARTLVQSTLYTALIERFDSS